MKPLVLLSAACMMLGATAFAANMNPDIIGKAIDESGNPVPYVNVVLLSRPDSTYVQGGMSDESGQFSVVTDVSNGILRISSMGYETQYIDIPAQGFGKDGCVISMRHDTKLLDEVVVTAALPTTRIKGDALQTIISGTILEKAGSATDVLNKLPAVTADKDGAVKVFGRGDAEVYINGRKVQDLRELERLRSEQIQSIDVVQNPGARYAAATKAVVRIQLKKKQGDGISFIESARANYQYKWTATNNFDLNYRRDGLDVTTSLWCGSYGGRTNAENHLSYFAGPDKINGIVKQQQNSRWEGYSPQIQVNYMVNDKHSFGAFYKWDRNTKNHLDGWLNTDSYKNGEFVERSESDLWMQSDSKKHIFNAYYNGKVRNLSIDFNLDGLFDHIQAPNVTDEVTIAPEQADRYRHVENVTENKNNFMASKLVFSLPVKKVMLSFGGEYTYNNRKDAYSYVCDEPLPVVESDAEIKESAYAAFVETSYRLGKVAMQAGLRYEHLSNDYYNFGEKESDVCRNYGDWFPTASVSMPVKNVQMSLSYRRDIKRPAYHDLSSHTIYINRYTFQCGNPYLTPTYTHSLALNTAYKWMSLYLSLDRTIGSITFVTEPFPASDDPLVSLVHPANAANGYNGFTAYYAAQPTIGIWHPRWSAAAQWQDYKTLCADGSMISLNHPIFQFGWRNDIELPRDFRLNLNAQFTTKGDVTNYRQTKTVFSSYAGVQKDFNMKSLGTLTASLWCSDIFNTNHNAYTIFGVRELSSLEQARRTIGVNLTWKFNEARKKYKGTGAGEKQKSRM